jgi:hypothetical protein
MDEKRPDQMDALVSAIAELARPPDPEVLRLMAEHGKRPRHFSQAAKLMIDIATGAVEDGPPPKE